MTITSPRTMSGAVDGRPQPQLGSDQNTHSVPLDNNQGNTQRTDVRDIGDKSPAPQEASTRSRRSVVMDVVHTGLDILGAAPIPLVSTPANLLNGVIHVAEGKPLDAALDFAGAIPIPGAGTVTKGVKIAKAGANVVKDVVKGAEVAKDVVKGTEVAKDVVKGAEVAKDLVKGAETAKEATKVQPFFRKPQQVNGQHGYLASPTPTQTKTVSDHFAVNRGANEGPSTSQASNRVEIDTTPINHKESKAALKPHVEKLNAERKELDKWNSDGSGRNQGLRHITDYGYARPPATKNDKLMKLMDHQVLSGKKVREELKLSSADFEKLATKDLEPGSMTPAGKKLKQESDELGKDMKSMMKGSPSEKKAIGQSPEYKQKQSRQKELKEQIQDETFYSLRVDDSKKGRIELVEQSRGSGRFKDDKEIHGSEIIGVTRELDRLKTLPSTTSKHTPPPPKEANKTFSSNDWVKNENESQWKKQPQTLPDTAARTTHNTDSNGSKLNIETWTPNPEKIEEKYSTVMGGHKKLD